MRLAPDVPHKNKAVEVLTGTFKFIIGVFLLWFGCHSFLMGWAYDLERGSWVPRLVGFLLFFLGLYLLLKSIRQVSSNLSPRTGNADY